MGTQEIIDAHAERREQLIEATKAALSDFSIPDCDDENDDWYIELHERIASL